MSGNALSLTKAEEDIIRERSRQVSEEGWSSERDDAYISGELARAAAAYCESAARPKLFSRRPGAAFTVPMSWPSSWSREWWKPTNSRRDLVKAGALIIAEIERLDRAAIAKAEGKPAGNERIIAELLADDPALTRADAKALIAEVESQTWPAVAMDEERPKATGEGSL